MNKRTVERIKNMNDNLLNICFRLSFIKKLTKQNQVELKTIENELYSLGNKPLHNL